MNIKCGLCGKDIVVADDLADGQHIRCPYCGEKSEYRKPTRIELPTGVVRQPRDQETSLEGDDGMVQDGDMVPEIPAYKRNPNLYIRRAGENGSNVENGRRNALVDQVEARARAGARKKLMAKVRRFVSNVVVIAALAALATFGYKLYKVWNGDAGRMALTEIAGRDEVPVPITGDQLESRDGEKSVSHGSETVVDSDSTSKSEQDERKTQAGGSKVVRERFVGCSVSYWSKLKKRPGTVDGLFYLMVPSVRDARDYYEIRSTTNALTLLCVDGRSAGQKELGYDDYAKLLTEKGGFIFKDGVAHLVTAKCSRKTYQAPTRKGESFNPSEVVFSSCYAAAKEMDTSSLRFEVWFALDDKQVPQKVASVPFGKTIPYEAFEPVAASIAKELRRKNTPPSLKVKTYKRTVVLYDGRLTSRGMGGVTKVPRKYPNARGESYSEWVRLHDEAVRQENVARGYAAEAQRARKEWAERMNGPANEDEIRKVLCAGIVTVKRM